MSKISRPNRSRLLGATALILGLAACEQPLDPDLRGQIGAFSTAPAAQGARTAPRPSPDERGVISYPNYQVAVARRGDTVVALSERVGLQAGEIARFNGLRPDDRLREGEILALPRRVAEPVGQAGEVDIAAVAGDAIGNAPDTAVSTAALEPARPAEARPAGPEPVRHKVKRGETAYTISRLYQVPVKSLADWNGLGPDFAVREGQYLIIPVTEAQSPAAAAAAVSAAAVNAPGTGTPTPTPPSAAQPLPEEQVSLETPEPPDVDIGEPTVASNSILAYPVQGKIIRSYEKGKSEGIDIAADPGTPVSAAEDGTVAAITADADEVPIIVVRHKDNLLTVYANVESIEVNKGDKVTRGQQIAKLRGGSDAYVHFEVRKGFDSVDPEPYLN